MDKRIKKNYILNLIYEIFALIVPIFVTPYVSRVLTVTGVGIYSYTYSIIYYFIMLGTLGFSVHGRRIISAKKDSFEEQKNSFWEIVILKAFSTLISAIIFVAFSCTFYNGSSYFVYIISTIFYLIGVFFDIGFYFQGNEKFTSIIIKNIIIKLLGVILIFVLIKDSDDLLTYIILQGLIYSLSAVSLWVSLPRRIWQFSLKKLKFKKHLKPSLLLFIPTIATSLYMIFDKTLIGLLVKETYVVTQTTIVDGVPVTTEIVKKVSDIENGVYEGSEKIIKLIVIVITSLSAIISPRNSYYFEIKRFDKIKELVNNSLEFGIILGIPLTIGICLLSKDFCPLYFGDGFEKTVYLMMIMAPLIIFIGLSTTLGMQYLIPTGKDNKYIISVSIGAILNIILNFIFIPVLYSYGAAISTVIAEMTIMIFMIIFSRKIIKFKEVFFEFVKTLFAGLIMFGCLLIVINFIHNIYARMIIAVVLGTIVYFTSLIILKERLLLSFMNRKNVKTDE